MDDHVKTDEVDEIEQLVNQVLTINTKFKTSNVSKAYQ